MLCPALLRPPSTLHPPIPTITHCLQPRDSVGEAGLSVEEQARQALDTLTERIPETFDLEDIRGRVDEFTPYVM